jgi:hypothetical protein
MILELREQVAACNDIGLDSDDSVTVRKTQSRTVFTNLSWNIRSLHLSLQVVGMNYFRHCSTMASCRLMVKG